jgi:AraC family transcriptional regulator of adaptative response / DNA-3-methyladenine glycosylase II
MNQQNLDRELCYRALSTRDARFDGRFFTAVLTTGIFCRPTCPARTPRPQNCAFYPSAAAAHAAGFRPCLRCRPEVAPGLAGWRGTVNTVRRALDLISEGALDDRDMENLAGRLGIGSRHLRRLFHRHLGASPVAVAQTHRLLFAKKLLTETGLDLADVAHASGFGSVRRFNAAVRQAYGRPPRELRRGLERPESAGIQVKLSFKPPYDWPAMLDYLRARAISSLEEVENDRYRRSFVIDGAAGVVEVGPLGRSELGAVIDTDGVGPIAAIVARLRRVFDLDADLDLIRRDLSREPLLAPLVEARPGLRVPGAWEPYELAVRAVLGQQVSVAHAVSLATRMVERHGDRLPSALRRRYPGLSRLFPRPSVLARSDLATLGMPGARARSIASLAAAVSRDPDVLSPLAGLDEIVRRLRALPGIGEWTAHYIALRALREPDAFPAADAGLLRAMERNGKRPTPRELLASSQAWRPWRAYAAQHLWTKA